MANMTPDTSSTKALHIDVQALLPLRLRNLADEPESPPVEMPTSRPDDHWVTLLHVPVESLERIDGKHPWRWLLFASGIIIGTSHGWLSLSPDLDHAALDLDSALIEDNVFFHVPDEHRLALLPADPELYNSEASSISGCSKRTADLREQLRDRDRACVVTRRVDRYCVTAHLIPHRKGDEYIKQLTRRALGDGDIIGQIDSVRNAILVEPPIHRDLGEGVAIMRKPNFAYPHPHDSWEYHVVRDLGRGTDLHGTSVTVPQDMSNWPPEILFEHVYASAVWLTFGLNSEARTRIATLCEKYYGPGGRINSTQCQHKRATKRDGAGTSTEKFDDVQFDDGEPIPYFAIWQDILSPEMQRVVYEESIQVAREKALAAVNTRVMAWRQL